MSNTRNNHIYCEYNITQDLVEKARSHASSLMRYNKNFKQHSVQNGEFIAKTEGTLGELIAEQWLKDNNFIYEDMRLSHELDYKLDGIIELEIKTKVRTVPPKPDYEATVPQYVHDIQQPLAYLFISLVKEKQTGDKPINYIRAYVVGGLSRSKFDDQKRDVSKNQFDPSNKWSCSEACYNIYIHELFQPQEFAIRMKQYIDKKQLSY